MLFFSCLWMNVTKTRVKQKLVSMDWKNHPVKGHGSYTVILPYIRTDFYNYCERTYRNCFSAIRKYKKI